VTQCKYSTWEPQWLQYHGNCVLYYEQIHHFDSDPKSENPVPAVPMDQIKSCCRYYSKANDEVECVEVIGIRDILILFHIPLMLFDFRKEWIWLLFCRCPS
jgi:hypothetical protein